MTDDQFRAAVLEKLDNLASLQEETALEVAAVKTRLGNVENTVNRIASKVRVQSIPALGGSGRSVESLAAKGADSP
ncbi:MAG: hypothetical protein OXG35_13285 [Acidobacteria bacterium]|nr:hypothetical protein [Acidobacteriota bacterium]